MTHPSIKFLRSGEPGTLGAVCNLYFKKPGHMGCPFQYVCPADNGPAKDDVTLRILYSVDAGTLEVMAKAIRETKGGDAT
jgi:hypothetical protein